MSRRTPLLIVLLCLAACAATPDRHTFRNVYPHPEKAGFWKWKWEQWRDGLPKKPPGGYHFEVAQPEHASEEVREGARGPLLEARRRSRVLEIVGELRPATDRARPFVELPSRSRRARRQPSLEASRTDHRERCDLMASGSSAQ